MVLALGSEGARTHTTTALTELAKLPGDTTFLRALIKSLETREP
jgi:hypothetical protein